MLSAFQTIISTSHDAVKTKARFFLFMETIEKHTSVLSSYFELTLP
jgi:hypothetical protein